MVAHEKYCSHCGNIANCDAPHHSWETRR
jgi:hypothetical protein